MKALGDRVIEDPAARTPGVQEAWGSWEARMREDVARDSVPVRAGLEERVDELLSTRRRLLGKGD